MSEHVQDPYVFSNNASTFPPLKANQPAKSKWWQFGLKSILIAMTGISILVACIAAPAIPAIGLSIAGVGYLVALIVAMFYGRGWIRPYAICGLLTIFTFLFICAGELPFRGPLELLGFLGITFFATNFIGFSGAISHGFLSRRSGKVPVPNIWFLRNWLSND